MALAAACAGGAGGLAPVRRAPERGFVMGLGGMDIATGIGGGALFASRPLSEADPHTTDLAPTVLQPLGVPIPEGKIDGEPVL